MASPLPRSPGPYGVYVAGRHYPPGTWMPRGTTAGITGYTYSTEDLEDAEEWPDKIGVWAWVAVDQTAAEIEELLDEQMDAVLSGQPVKSSNPFSSYFAIGGE